MTMKNELAVRAWVRRLDLRKEWTESSPNAYGATNGQADVKLFSSDGVAYPIELKCWDLLKMGHFAARIRREQIRWHHVTNKAGTKTLILWGSPDIDGLWCLPGVDAPKSVVSRVDPAKCHHFGFSDGERFTAALLNNDFWN